jgi:hypothetical protein
VNGASDVFLGLIALAAVVMAAVQVILVVLAVRLVKRVDALSTQIDREIAPLAEKLKRVADHLQQATGLATVQVERLDRLFAGATKRADETMSLVQGAVVGPIREGLAVVAALRGVFLALRGFRRDGPPRAPAKFDDEDPLFIG